MENDSCAVPAAPSLTETLNAQKDEGEKLHSVFSHPGGGSLHRGALKKTLCQQSIMLADISQLILCVLLQIHHFGGLLLRKRENNNQCLDAISYKRPPPALGRCVKTWQTSLFFHQNRLCPPQ